MQGDIRMSDYEADLLAWTERQADLLRRRAANEIDWDNLAEEIEAVGRSERRELRSRLKVLMLHLLKWAYQPEHRSNSWRGSILDQRDALARLLADSPSLRRFLPDYAAEEYAGARTKAEMETGLLRLPAVCPWTVADITDEGFWPDAG